jgi:hypothetical protein
VVPLPIFDGEDLKRAPIDLGLAARIVAVLTN